MEEKTPIISFRNADIINGEATVIYDFNMDVFPGDFVYIVGKVGTGKTSIISPLLTAGVSIKRTLLISLAIAFISMTGTVLGGMLVNVTNAILPFILTFAGGTMLYVVSDEMIPETHSHGYEKAATFSILGGFLLILVMQKLLGA